MPVGTRGGFAVGLKSYPRTLDLADGEFVLTFDDGPRPGPTERVLDTLACANVKATFFMIGRNAAAHPGLVRRARAEGHTIACHTWSHPWTLRELPETAARRDIEAGFDAIAQALGEPCAPFFRFPGFADTPALVDWLASRDVGVFGCDIWASDWSPLTPEAEFELAWSRSKRQRRGIVLFHDVHARTAAMLPRYLAALSAGSNVAVHLIPEPGPAQTRPAAPGWSSEAERMIGLARQGRR